MKQFQSNTGDWAKLIIGIALVSTLGGVNADTLAGRVVADTDGDTITVLDAGLQQHKIRLAGIDAPEKKQPFGERSTQSLAALVFGKTVVVEWRKKHRERLIGKVTVSGVDANLEQIKAGMAWWYEKYRKEQSPADQRRYAEAEQQQARAARVGLWRDQAPVPPWEWRALKKTVH